MKNLMTKEQFNELYGKAVLTKEDREMILKSMDQSLIEVDEIMESFMDYACLHASQEMLPLSIMDVWKWTGEHYQNLMSHSQNYANLVNSLCKQTNKQ